MLCFLKVDYYYYLFFVFLHQTVKKLALEFQGFKSSSPQGILGQLHFLVEVRLATLKITLVPP